MKSCSRGDGLVPAGRGAEGTVGADLSASRYRHAASPPRAGSRDGAPRRSNCACEVIGPPTSACMSAASHNSSESDSKGGATEPARTQHLHSPAQVPPLFSPDEAHPPHRARSRRGPAYDVCSSRTQCKRKSRFVAVLQLLRLFLLLLRRLLLLLPLLRSRLIYALWRCLHDHLAAVLHLKLTRPHGRGCRGGVAERRPQARRQAEPGMAPPKRIAAITHRGTFCSKAWLARPTECFGWRRKC